MSEDQSAPTGSEESPSGRVLTIPNLVTSVRLALIPVFVWIFLGGDRDLLAFALMFVIGSTDWVDGFLARKLGQVSELGKVIDPVADRLAIIALVGSLVFRGFVPLALAAVIVGRDIIMAIALGILEARKTPRIDVNWVGKWATAAIYVGMGVVIFDVLLADTRVEFGIWLMWVGAALYWVASAMYAIELRKVLASSGGSRL